MKFLIIQQKYMGDVLISSLIATNIKKQFPNSEINFLCYPNHAQIIENNPSIDQIITVNEKNLKKFNILLKTAKLIKNQKYDYIIDPYGKFQSKVICRLSKAKHRIGFQKKDWFGAYTEMIDPKEIKPTKFGLVIDHRLALINSIMDSSKFEMNPKVYLTDKELKDAKDLLISGGISFQKPIIMIGILGSKEEKTYPLEYMGELVNFVAENYDADILFNYIPKQNSEVQKILKFVKDENKSKIKLDIIGRSIREFVAMMTFCDLHISNEGGGCHISKALEVPTFTVFSPYIEVNVWDTFPSAKNQSVHLKQYKADLYDNYKQKEHRKNSLTLYSYFKFNYFKNKLNKFIQDNLNK